MLNSLNFSTRKNTNTLKFKANAEPVPFVTKTPSVFIAMPMPDGYKAQKWDKLNETIKKVAKESCLPAGRIDDILDEKSSGNPLVAHEIMKEIDNSDIVIADLTEPKPNVYFELGYAIGKGKKVFPIARSGTALPFDISSFWTTFYNTYFYNEPSEGKPSDLQKKLSKKLKGYVERQTETNREMYKQYVSKNLPEDRFLKPTERKA